jgi:GNAT superfamily N-acetyltransferase
MHIERVTPGTPEHRIKQWHAVEVAVADRTDWPLPPLTLAELTGHAQHPGGDPIGRYDALLAIEDDDVVGFAHCWWWSAENRHLVDSSVHVLPERRRRGIGRTLIERLIEDARADGRRSLTMPARQGADSEQFVQAMGATESLVERHSILEIADVDWALVERSAPPAPGYRLVSWDEDPPEELLPSLARAQESMDDAPKGTLDILRDTWTTDMLRAIYALSAARGYRRLVIAAVHEESGEVAGFTELQIPPGRNEYGEQGDTVVVPEHRGHRLGMSIKSAMLQRVRCEAPELERISTWNAEENQWMLAVNVALGFRPAELWGMYQLTLG